MHRFQSPARRTVAVLAAAFVCAPSEAQMATFKHFKPYPTTGQWQQELVAYRDGKALGPPMTSTTCASPLDGKSALALGEAMKGMVPTCTTKVLADQEQLAESETVCKLGAGMQTLHTQMRPVDDRTIAVETRSTLAGAADTMTKSKVTYLGACPAGAAAAQARPSAQDCAELATVHRDNEAAGGAAQCAQLPPQYRARCESGQKALAALEQRCK